MSILFDKEKLLEVFDFMRVHDREAEVVEYFVTGEHKTELSLYISTYDQYATVMLMRPDKKSWLFDVDINNVAKIVCDDSKLNFYREENEEEPALTVTFKPYISLSCRAAVPEDKP